MGGSFSFSTLLPNKRTPEPESSQHGRAGGTSRALTNLTHSIKLYLDSFSDADAAAGSCDLRYSLLMSQTEGLYVVRRSVTTHSDLFIAVGGDDVPVVGGHGLAGRGTRRQVKRHVACAGLQPQPRYCCHTTANNMDRWPIFSSPCVCGSATENEYTSPDLSATSSSSSALLNCSDVHLLTTNL